MTILVAGATGLAGSGILRGFERAGKTAVGVSSKDVNLLDRKKTFEFIQELKPSLIIDAAARVGGIGANDAFPVNFISENLQIQCNLMDAAHAAKVERFVFLGSSCIYPRDSAQPYKEEYFLTGLLEKSNSAYAVAKIAGIEMINSYRKQYGYKWISLMPTNLYGPNDNFDLASSHVLAAFIRKFVEAVDTGIGELTLWGSGSPRREFLHTDDLADAVVFCTENYDETLHLNIGTGIEISIKSLAELVARVAGYSGDIHWDATKPDGTPRKVMDISRVQKLGWSSQIGLEKGIAETIEWYRRERLGKR